MLRLVLPLLGSLLFAGHAFADSSSDVCSSDVVYQGPTLRTALDDSSYPESEIDKSQSIPNELADRLDQSFFKLVGSHTNATSASVALWSENHGFWTADFGISAAGTPNVYWWASVGKLVTASIILQNVRDGQLSLNDPISRWFENYPNGELITIDHLLTHTGGVFNFNSDRKLHQQSGSKPLELLIETSAGHGADFCPGTNWNYSNTGYVMLSHIAENITSLSFTDLVHTRISEPLQTTTLGVIEPSDLEDVIVSPAGETPPGIADIASIYGAGAIRANATDMLLLLNAYLRGGITSPELRDAAFAQLYPMFGSTMHYGRGVMATDVPDSTQPTIWLGHVGGSPNAKALVIYDVKRRTYVAMVLNVDAPAEAITNALLKILDEAE